LTNLGIRASASHPVLLRGFVTIKGMANGISFVSEKHANATTESLVPLLAIVFSAK
jgi:hypothetical protein